MSIIVELISEENKNTKIYFVEIVTRLNEGVYSSASERFCGYLFLKDSILKDKTLPFTKFFNLSDLIDIPLLLDAYTSARHLFKLCKIYQFIHTDVESKIVFLSNPFSTELKNHDYSFNIFNEIDLTQHEKIYYLEDSNEK